MKQLFRSMLLSAIVCAGATLALAQEAQPTPPPSDRESRKEAERRRRDEEKEAQHRQGVRCQRLRQKG